ncbi:MAG TPA: hypothetical protein VF226_05430 [Hyphomicrobiaceae bacterium]
MRKVIHAGLIAGAATVVLAGVSVTEVYAFEVSKVELGVADSGGSSCPRDAKITAWAHTDGPGTVKFVIRNDSGGKTGVLSANAVKGPTGNYLATYSHTFKITTDVDIKYMAEVVGHPKISKWVPLKAKCGPQPRKNVTTSKSGAKPPARAVSDDDGPKPRKTTSTKSSGGGPKAKHTSESEDKGKPTSGGGKPIPSGGGKPIPSGGKPIATCKPMISVTRTLAVTRAGGLATARAAWQSTALAAHGAAYARWSNAKDQSSSCSRKGLTFNCTVKARPCKG